MTEQKKYGDNTMLSHPRHHNGMTWVRDAMAKVSPLYHHFSYILLLLALTSCHKEPLFYEYENSVTVQVAIDWTKAGVHPNGTSVFIYNMDGTLYRHNATFLNPSFGTLTLPAGDYKLIAFSDIPDDYTDYLSFKDMEHWQTASVQTITDAARSVRAKAQMEQDAAVKAAAAELAKAKADSVLQAAKASGDSIAIAQAYKLMNTVQVKADSLLNARTRGASSTTTRGERGINVGAADIGLYVKAPDTLAVARVDSFHVDQQMLDYLREEPDEPEGGYPPLVVCEANTIGQRVVQDFRFIVHVKGLVYAKGQTETDLVGVSRGYYLGKGLNMDDKVTHTFVLNNRKFDEGSNTDGTITASQLSFGVTPDKDSRYYLVMHFVLVNGEDYPVTADITEQITQADVVQVNVEARTIVINLDLELPKVNGVSNSISVSNWCEDIFHMEI